MFETSHLPTRRTVGYALLVLALTVSLLWPAEPRAQGPDSTTTAVRWALPEADSDVPFVPTREAVVDRMLEVAEVSERDTVFDLGSGDGRIVIRAAGHFGARGRGVEIEPLLVRDARERARSAGVSDRVRFLQADLFEADLSEATVVTLYLARSLNVKLRPKLLEELAPGTRVVSHDFDMGAWKPDRVVHEGEERIFLWIVPEKTPDHLEGNR